jgi:predicted metal-dependent phosphoesterase TrpH
MLIDLHTHTSPNSDDSFLSPGQLIRKAKEAGLDGICLTEHDWYWTNGAILPLVKENDFLVIPGVEINTEVGHIIAFGVDEFKFGTHHVSVLREELDKNGGYMILAHPYRHKFYSGDAIAEAVEKCRRDSVFKYVDNIEVFNGKAQKRQNEFSLELAKQLGWKGTGGSDAHDAKDIPSCATYFERKIRNRAELIQELKSGRYKPVDLRSNTNI